MNDQRLTVASAGRACRAGLPLAGTLVRHGWLLAAVTAAQLGTVAALRLMPLAALRAGTDRCRRVARLIVHDPDERIAWALEATGPRLGRLSSCLARAVVAEMLLAPTGDPVHLCIGVRLGGAGGTFQAHAWVARADRVLVGAPAEGYEPIATWTRYSE